MPRIAVVGTDLAPLDAASGALERTVLQWASGLEASSYGIEVVRLDADGVGGPPTARLEQCRPDLVVLNNRPLWAEAVKTGLPVLQVLHNYPDAWGDHSEDRERVRRALERTNGLVRAVSGSLARHVEESFALKRAVMELRPGVEQCFFDEDWHGQGDMVVFPNRLLEKKGVRLFLELAEVLASRGYRPVLFRHLAPWSQPTVEQQALLELVAKQSSAELLDPPATRGEMASWYARAGVVVCPSLSPEGLGLVALEAQAVGVPIVTSGLGGLLDATFAPNEIVTDPDLGRWCAAIERAVSRSPSLAPRQRTENRHSPDAATASILEAVLEAGGLASSGGARASNGAPGYSSSVVTARPRETLSDRYRLGARLGQGGMAEVFAAEDLRLGRQVAIKMLRPQLGADETVRYRFEQEARTAAKLSHPNVVGILDTGEDDGVAFIIMERLPGTTLADELAGGPLDEGRVKQVARQVLSALAAAHGAGIVHRDIKPANVLTCPGGLVKVADFGIATAMDEAQSITTTGLLIGTPAYLAPERLAGTPATASADLYSLASVLYQCLTGRRPFEAASTIELIMAVRDGRPEPIEQLRPGVDPDLARLIERTLDKDPAARPSSAAAMGRLLTGADDDMAGFGPAVAMTEVMAQPQRDATVPLFAQGSTEILTRPEVIPGQPAMADRVESTRRRLAAMTEPHRAFLAGQAKHHRVPLVFFGALLLALVIALSLSSSSPRTAPLTPSRTTTSLPVLAHVPASLAHAIDHLAATVG
ncbi:MAG: protein kinase domain-containing protein [Acidimicrobiales bacterium]